MATTCEGTWGFARPIESPGSTSFVWIQRCTGCNDRLVTFNGRAYDVADDATDAEILSTVTARVLETLVSKGV